MDSTMVLRHGDIEQAKMTSCNTPEARGSRAQRQCSACTWLACEQGLALTGGPRPHATPRTVPARSPFRRGVAFLPAMALSSSAECPCPGRSRLPRLPGGGSATTWRLVPLLQLATACTPPAAPAIRSVPPLPFATGAAPPRVDGAIGTRTATTPPQLAYGMSAEPRLPTAAAGQEEGNVSLDFVDTDIREVAAQILGTILRVNFTIDPAVRGSATLRTVQPLSQAQMLPALQVLLTQNGATLVRSGSLYRVVPVAQGAAAMAAEGLGGSIVVPLRFAGAEELARVLQPYTGDGGRIVADPGRNALLVGAEPQARGSLIQAFDIDILARQSYALLPVNTGDVRDVATALQEALRGQSGGALAGFVRVVPMARVNAVLVISQQARYIDEARRVYGLMERARRQTVRGWHVHYLQNGIANDIAYLLQTAFTPNAVTAQVPRAIRNGPGRPGVGGSGLQVAGGAGQGGTGVLSGRPANGPGGGGFGGGFGGGQGLGGQRLGGLGGVDLAAVAAGNPLLAQALPPPAAPGAANPLLGPLEPGGADNNPDALRIIPDTQNNALLYYATQRETDAVQAMLRRVDILPLQVRIDAVIAEVMLNDRLQYGTQFYFRSGGLNGILDLAQGAFNPAALAFGTTLPGFILGTGSNSSVPFALNALQDVTTVKVLSSPQLLVVDNQTARLQVGDVVPYLSQTSQSIITPNAPVVSSINYQQTGVVMEITPRVNSGGLVTLDVTQNVSDVARTITTQSINSPTFQERSVTSRVVVQDGQAIGLAGLIRDNLNTNNLGIPWLKDIPLLGALLAQQSNTRQRTELLILITPHVMHDQRTARALTEDLREQVINAAAVPDQLNNRALSGSSDPNERVRQKIRQQIER